MNNDTISRQAVLNLLIRCAVPENGGGLLYQSIKQLPSAERIGKWIDPQDTTCYKCSVCGEYATQEYGLTEPIFWRYCPNCGALMDKNWEEPEINPCRGCRDYDGRGGCKSNGSCARDEVEV